jgi:hypothetical protein
MSRFAAIGPAGAAVSTVNARDDGKEGTRKGTRQCTHHANYLHASAWPNCKYALIQHAGIIST